MPADDVKVLRKYRQHMKFAASKAWRKYGPTVDPEEIDQAAREAVLIFAGVWEFPQKNGRPHVNFGKLAEWEKLPDGKADRFIQHAIDLYVYAFAGHQVDMQKYQKRRINYECDSLDALIELGRVALWLRRKKARGQ